MTIPRRARGPRRVRHRRRAARDAPDRPADDRVRDEGRSAVGARPRLPLPPVAGVAPSGRFGRSSLAGLGQRAHQPGACRHGRASRRCCGRLRRDRGAGRCSGTSGDGASERPSRRRPHAAGERHRDGRCLRPRGSGDRPSRSRATSSRISRPRRMRSGCGIRIERPLAQEARGSLICASRSELLRPERNRRPELSRRERRPDAQAAPKARRRPGSSQGSRARSRSPSTVASRRGSSSDTTRRRSKGRSRWRSSRGIT